MYKYIIVKQQYIYNECSADAVSIHMSELYIWLCMFIY